MYPKWVYTFVIIIAELICDVYGKSELLDGLLSKCDPRVMPRVPGGDALKVHISVALREIISLDAKSQIMTTSIWLRTHWIDYGLIWDPEDFEGIDKIHVPHRELWKPDLMLYDNTDMQYHPLLQDVSAVVWYNGSVSFVYPAIFKTTCLFAIYSFPFDQQECSMRIGSWTYDKSELELVLDEKYPTDVRFYKMNSEWSLVRIKAALKEYFELDCCDTHIHDISFNVTMRRRAIMQIYYLYFPNALINVIATFQFLLPCDSAEKVTLGITILLAMIVYLLLMAEMLPMTDVVPNIVEYMTITLTLVTISLVITIIVLQVHHNGKHDNHSQLPWWARRWLLHGLARVLNMHHYITSDEEHLGKLLAATSHISLIEEDDDNEGETSQEGTSEHACNTGQLGTSVHNVLSSLDRDRKSSSAYKGFPIPSQSKIRPGHPSIADMRKGMRGRSVQLKKGDLGKNKELLLLKILKHCEEFSERAANETRDQELASEWQQLAMIIDRLFFYIFCVVTFIVWIVIFMNKPTYSDEIIV